jgi:hypothetical protein
MPAMMNDPRFLRLKKAAEAEGLLLPDPVVGYLVGRFADDRALEGAFLRLIEYAASTDQEVSLPLAESVDYDNDEPEEQSPSGEWVATGTFISSSDGTMWEEGGIYPGSDRPVEDSRLRPFEASEHVAACPRCGQRFAATDDGTAESHRDLHFDGDEDIPSICRNLPTQRRFHVVEKKGGA